MSVERCNYIVNINMPKRNGQYLSQKDLINVGYMAGRYGVNLDGNLNGKFRPIQTENGLLVNINCCTKDSFEKNLKDSGINFMAIG